uniref:Uncharacterized protein n=1 Tax=Meloidogyne enterolobii TaxID=390850 RepID=A0A6V7U1P2_MELEN|nr:unnamed protein product [Meloidogyne enterolobii]
MLKPIKWWPSSCQTRRRTAVVPLVRCNDLLVLNGWSFDSFERVSRGCKNF